MSFLSFRIPARDDQVNLSPAPAPSKLPPSTPVLRARLATFLREAWRRHRSRQQLATLDDRVLKDIGLTRSDAFQESAKRFWQP